MGGAPTTEGCDGRRKRRRLETLGFGMLDCGATVHTSRLHGEFQMRKIGNGRMGHKRLGTTAFDNYGRMYSPIPASTNLPIWKNNMSYVLLK
ncbi:hypothetical protein E3N88_39303 [Mikania micrantha]|uniref:Uncharacterized protein n=1 Tax=Mikania micrantha TaxID=192012 RepID=A0A5N6LWF0_9ASTR|nr:hypothetical protein E3N88_39303 [Mikania micrantha]